MTTLPGMPTAPADTRQTAKKWLPRPKDARSRLDPTRQAQIDKIASTAPEQAKRAYLACIAGNSKVKALKVMCWHCCGWVRAEVGRCTAKGCPLWAFRPYQREAADAT